MQRLLDQLLVKPTVLFFVDDYIIFFYDFLIFLQCNTLSAAPLLRQGLATTDWKNWFLDVPIQKPLKSNNDIRFYLS